MSSDCTTLFRAQVAKQQCTALDLACYLKAYGALADVVGYQAGAVAGSTSFFQRPVVLCASPLEGESSALALKFQPDYWKIACLALAALCAYLLFSRSAGGSLSPA